MQYNHYHSTSHHALPTPHPSEDYPPSYPDPSHQHAALSYAAVTPDTPLPTGSITHHNVSYPYAPYATQGTPDDHRSYFPSSPQGVAIENYPAPSSPTTPYGTPSPGHMNPQPSRHHAHLSQSHQHFFPTPSQAYQYSSTAPAPSTRSRPAVEPYYHMSPNPQHVVQALPPSTTHGAGVRNGTVHHSSSNPHHTHASTHTGTIAVAATAAAAAAERYVCGRCGRTFTRLHDRRRHFDTVHSTTPAMHKCRYCRRDFSRSDSLKRHVDNGCEEMPR